MTSHFWVIGSTGLSMPTTISYWGREVLAKADMSPGSLQGAAASAALAAGVCLVSIMQTGDWARVSTLARHYISPYITTMDWH